MASVNTFFLHPLSTGGALWGLDGALEGLDGALWGLDGALEGSG